MQASRSDIEGFGLGAPALVCRWRLAGRRLPLENRHVRALLARTVNGEPLSKELAAWVKQHLEWTLDDGAAAHPDGVLMLVVDDEGRAAMTVGPYAPLASTHVADLLDRAEAAQAEAALTGVAPETLWVARAGTLAWDPGEGCAPSGAASLVEQLAQTMGAPVERRTGLAAAIRAGEIACDEALLVSDEHGVVPADDATGPWGQELAGGLGRLRNRVRA